MKIQSITRIGIWVYFDVSYVCKRQNTYKKMTISYNIKDKLKSFTSSHYCLIDDIKKADKLCEKTLKEINLKCVYTKKK